MSQQENIYELPLFKAHVLLLADIVADFSGRTELAKKGKVKELFLRQVKPLPCPMQPSCRQPLKPLPMRF